MRRRVKGSRGRGVIIRRRMDRVRMSNGADGKPLNLPILHTDVDPPCCFVEANDCSHCLEVV